MVSLSRSDPASPDPGLPPELAGWFVARGWRLRRHQAEVLENPGHALVMADTGAGKTLAGFLPTLAAFCPSQLGDAPLPRGVHTLYVSPLKALAHDVRRNLLDPIAALGLKCRAEARSGDTPAARKARQRADPPEILLTTPESLALLLSWPEAEQMFAGLQRIVIDEIHALAPGKRGDLLALGLARLQRLAPGAQRIGLSATLADPQAFREWLAPAGAAESVQLVAGEPGAPAELEVLLPDGGRVPWGGHAATWAIPQLIAEIARNRTTLIFTNTRFLAEYIFSKLWEANGENLPIGLHHGSLAVEVRRKVESAMAEGRLRALVCTSSLDLGVDWGDVDLVVQVGAPKGASRMLQRIGRSNHRMDEPSKALFVPSNRFEVLECEAALEAVEANLQDSEDPSVGGLDVLAQHTLGMACAAALEPLAYYDEIRRAWPYRDLDWETFERVIDFVATGGYALRAYERYAKLKKTPDGKWRIANANIAQQYRLNVGTIIEDPMIKVRLVKGRGFKTGSATGPIGRNGRVLGELEEYFIDQLVRGDTFVFGSEIVAYEGMFETEA